MEFGKTRRVSHGINMIPLINVVFLLLIFFMLSTTLVVPGKVNIDTPLSKSSEGQEEVNLTLTILNDGTIYFNERTTSLAVLSSIFKNVIEQKTNINVLIKADAKAATKNVMSVLQAAQTSGITNVALATRYPIKK